MPDVCRETQSFVHVCLAIHDRLAHEGITNDDRDLIEFSCMELLTKLRPEFQTAANA